ncbi:MAG: ATP-binding cassette domain-containing protein [Bacillota bacterium]
MILETYELTKMYGDKVGCLEVCLSLGEGQIFGLLGPNGAGKSTLVKMLVSLLSPTSGSARLLGRPLGDTEVRRRIGYLPENFNYQPWLTADELLRFHASLCGMEPARTSARIAEVLELVGLAGKGRQKIGTYSKGMRQRLGLACALLNDPDLVFLDEPTSALDPLGRREVRQILLERKRRGKSVFLNSHLLSEVEMVCDHVHIINRGRVVRSGAMDELLSGATQVHMEIEGLCKAIVSGLSLVGHDLRVEGSHVTVQVDSRGAIPALVDAVVANGGRLMSLEPKRASLEDLYVELVKEGKRP